MSAAPKGFDPLYVKRYPLRDATITLERIRVSGHEAVSYRATVACAATGERLFACERWGLRTCVTDARMRASAMGLRLTAPQAEGTR